MSNSIKTGDIYYFNKGKRDRFISHTGYGKVIIAESFTSRGFAEIVSFNEKETVIIAKVKRCLYDYYDGMSYINFKRLVLGRGYKLAFEQPFKRTYYASGEGEKSTDEMRLVVYSEKLHMIIVADTIESMSTFNSIDCYCYGVNALKLDKTILLSEGSLDYTVFNLCYGNIERPLHIVESYCNRGTIEKISNHRIPYGYTYAEDPQEGYGFAYFEVKFFNQCPKELRDWFE